MHKNVELEQIYEDYLLEKDHRASMIKFGTPQEVAEYLHQYNDKYSIWFANQFKLMPDYQKATDKVNWIRGTKEFKMREILDWISNVPNVMLKAFNWESAVQGAEDWHKNLETTKLAGVEKNTILKSYSDGYYWVDLKTKRCSEEGGAMGHCGTTHKADTIYSLRKFDANLPNPIEPVVTMAISPDDGIWYQAKGKKNSKPKDEYIPYIVDILIEKGVFVYESEYNSSNDFLPEDFKNYLEENPDKYPNTDEIISKLKESGLKAKADKIWAEYDNGGYFKAVSVNYEIEDYGDDTDFISCQGYASLKITEKEMPDLGYIRRLPNTKHTGLDGQTWTSHNKSLEKMLRQSLEGVYLYVSEEWSAGTPFEINDNPDEEFSLTVNLDFDMRSSDHYGDEISKFKSFLTDMEEVDKTLQEPNFTERFIEIFREELEEAGIIDNSIPMPRPEDPRQMKFKFAESVKFKDFCKL